MSAVTSRKKDLKVPKAKALATRANSQRTITNIPETESLAKLKAQTQRSPLQPLDINALGSPMTARTGHIYSSQRTTRPDARSNHGRDESKSDAGSSTEFQAGSVSDNHDMHSWAQSLGYKSPWDVEFNSQPDPFPSKSRREYKLRGSGQGVNPSAWDSEDEQDHVDLRNASQTEAENSQLSEKLEGLKTRDGSQNAEEHDQYAFSTDYTKDVGIVPLDVPDSKAQMKKAEAYWHEQQQRKSLLGAAKSNDPVGLRGARMQTRMHQILREMRGDEMLLGKIRQTAVESDDEYDRYIPTTCWEAQNQEMLLFFECLLGGW